ncbi:MAG: AAA family ATPase [Candidatus Sumerlaeota bacterium]|nr:AAA family ATPase [Candidatus Sumerlaeota bacterium]
MFFKTLEMNGFKSFATKTSVDFQPGITVIVGPNGCGKSNIFDAIRWVLGEQSARELRGTRMNDVIFAGSASLKAQGLAQVSLTVRNEERRLPIDFSEVNVTRRLYADGQSEYLLNKTPCRLKDITTLFMDTGIGAHGYSIMEQGKVDAIINAKPLERRYLFEEAAGTAKYRTRRTETMRKLERADADFLRLTDLLAEVRRNANSLKRQASKAERYKRLAQQAKRLERHLLHARHEHMKQRLAELTSAYDAVRDRLTALATRIAELEAAQEQDRDRETQMGERMAELRARQFELIREIEQREHAIVLLHERIAEGQRRQAQIDEESQTDAREDASVAEELERAKVELEEHRTRLKEAQGFYDETKTEFDELKTGLEGVVERLNTLRVELASLREKHSAADNAARLSRVLIQRLDEQIEANDRKHGELTEGAKALQARSEELARRHAERGEAIAARQAETETLARTNEEAARDAESLRREVQDRERELGHAASKLKALMDLEASYQGYYQGVRNVMQASGQGELRGLLGVVAQLVRSPAEYELAIEAALGGSVQDIVARSTCSTRASRTAASTRRCIRRASSARRSSWSPTIPTSKSP